MSILSFISRICKQDAVYWSKPTASATGVLTFPTPVQILVRWDSEEGVFLNERGEEYSMKAKILSSTTLQTGGWIYLGKLDELTAGEQSNPKTLTGAYEIRGDVKTPLIGSKTEFVHVYSL